VNVVTISCLYANQTVDLLKVDCERQTNST